MTRLVVFFISVNFIFACSINILDSENINTFKNLRDSITSRNASISYDDYNELNFSIARVIINGSLHVFSLTEVRGNEFIWEGPEQEVISTVNGKIVGIYGLFKDDIVFLNASDFNFTENKVFYISIGNIPIQVSTQLSCCEEKDLEIISNQFINANVVTEKFRSTGNEFVGENKYFFYKGRVVKSIQYLHPFEKQIEITFLIK